ncbi:MAG: PUR family DNA/RNA-binding protein [Flavobacteriales bacterium]|nr:PUR family DNA/RNA-binding protein [Flavobacteriales bacterium]
METNDKKDRRDDIFSRNVRAGKRTYFFDVKATRADDYYLTITESTKRFNDDGTFHYEKHRLFLYKEDFEKFADRLSEVTKYIINEKGTVPIRGESNHFHSNGVTKPADIAADASAPEKVPNDESAEENSIGAVKTEEEADLVEDAHEKAMAEDTSADGGEVDGNVADTGNGHANEIESTSTDNADPIDIKSEIGSKTE